ncbi:hypothetical protein [Rhizobium sp. PEPV16]|uniref:hypothetical protein n=1 Tax=Rhizobium sp. PEPV16 TaxID=1820614 RepID=UPI00124E98FE|nr:hypothetical protein [Rhizobium sp. PEPV16]KAF5887913.1 hypothetical protein FY112_01510 [Rhizobium sp. PEPV16]
MILPHPEIFYIYALKSWEANEVTPFQGFAPGLIPLASLLAQPAFLPRDIDQLTMPPNDQMARRRAGMAPWIWSPVNVETLIQKRKPLPITPFMVVFSADEVVARAVSKWRKSLMLKPLHVSTIQGVGALMPDELTLDRLRQFCRIALRQAKSLQRRLDISDSLTALDNWTPLEIRPSSIFYHGHNVTVANELALQSVGEDVPADPEGHLNASEHESYVQAITESSQAVLNLHDSIADRAAFLIHPRQPDMVLVAPASYRKIEERLQQNAPSENIKRVLRAMERQKGFTLSLKADEEDMDAIGPMMSCRGAELKLQSLAIALRSASTLAATIRLAPAVNRTDRVVAQLATHLRNYDNPPDTKTARVFKLVQQALADAVPPEHMELIRASKSGIKIIADAALEWLPVDGVPLGLYTDVSRIPVTPGNILLEQLRPNSPIQVTPDSFRNFLLLSMFDEKDQLADIIGKAVDKLKDSKGRPIRGTRRTPKTVEEFVGAINAYEGPMLIVDSHGQHINDKVPGGLIIGSKSVDMWSLRDHIRVPPIVILSACDTHPHDRNHASVANGFLSCGAVAVLATVLPIRGDDAASFVKRLLLRAVEYGGVVNDMGRSVPWTNIVGGALRMQLASDICNGLKSRGLITEAQATELQLSANMDLNPHRKDWLHRLASRCQENGGFDAARWQILCDDILAASDVIRYTHLGNPETIILSEPALFERFYKGFGPKARLSHGSMLADFGSRMILEGRS